MTAVFCSKGWQTKATGMRLVAGGEGVGRLSFVACCPVFCMVADSLFLPHRAAAEAWPWSRLQGCSFTAFQNSSSLVTIQPIPELPSSSGCSFGLIVPRLHHHERFFLKPTTLHLTFLNTTHIIFQSYEYNGY
jgi:hypothetical protein